MVLHVEDMELVAERDSYLHELKSKFEEIETLILELSGTDGKIERTRPLARQIHTIKGNAGSLGLDLLSVAAHRMEDLLASGYRDRKNDENLVDRLLAQNDLLAAIGAAYLDGNEQFLCEVRRQFAESDRPLCALARDPSLKRVLIVESSDVTLHFCARILKEFGAVEPFAVRDGYEALGCLLKKPFDAVIVSMQVPTIDGQSLITVLRMIPGLNAATPVILLTSATGSLDPAKAQADYVVEKNLGLANELRAILSRLAGSTLQRRSDSSRVKERSLKKILLVDDSREIHALVEHSFKRFPEIEVIGLFNPTLGVEYARRESPDLILLDVEMAPVSGKDVIRQIKAAPELSGIPVAFFTGSDDPEVKKELASLGACEIFKKPFSPKTFADHVISVFRDL